MSVPKPSGWKLIEDALFDVEATAAVMTMVADHVDDEENRASAFDTLSRHLTRDLAALRKGFSKAHADCTLVRREQPGVADVVSLVPRASAGDGDAA